MKNRNRPKVAILGAGIQGVSVALALNHAGFHVELFDRTPTPMSRTSLKGEGKLHLGYVYGNDSSLATAKIMVEGAMNFGTLLDSWLPKSIDWKRITSEPFTYAVLGDTMVPTDLLAEHYSYVDDMIESHLKRGAVYAGNRTFKRATKLRSPKLHGLSGDVTDAFLTSEVAIDPPLLAEQLVSALKTLNIAFHGNRNIVHVERNDQGFSITMNQVKSTTETIRADAGSGIIGAVAGMTNAGMTSTGMVGTQLSEPGATETIKADAVVNCLWDGRLEIDSTLGIKTNRTCMYRMKYAVHGTMKHRPEKPITTTFTLGPYGDVVYRNTGRVYLSWYPECLAGLYTGIKPPQDWNKELESFAITLEREEIIHKTTSALSEKLEYLRNLNVDSVTAGVIVAWGESDIDVHNSKLHMRHEIGVHNHDGYLSVDTGKLTTAPLFASRVVEQLTSYLKPS